jgi:cytochrome c oxidase cbb3-type subunit III
MRFLFVLCIAAASLWAQPQVEDRENPFGGNADAVEEGKKLFAGSCGGCHGTTGEGGRGPALRDGKLIRRSNDFQVFTTIRKGVAGTDMPGSNLPDEQVWKMVTFVRALSSPAADTLVPGDPAQGERVYASQGCSSCHMIGGRGGMLGPDLTNAGGTRSYEYLRESIVKPGARIQQGFAKATAKTKDGRVMEGVVRNYTNYDVQLQGKDGKLYLLKTTDLADFKVEVATFMPADYAKKISRQELTDLLAYLSRQTARPVELRRTRGARTRGDK